MTGLATGGFAVGYIGYNGNTGAINAFVNEYDAQGNLALSQQANSVTSGVQQVAVGDIGDGGFAAIWAGSQSGGAVQIKQQLFGSPLNLQQPSAQPLLSGVPGSVTYTLDGPAQLLAPAATLTDANAAVLNGGQVELSFTQGGGAAAQLGVNNQGTGAGQIGVTGSTVSYGGVAIGTLSGGVNGANLLINLNANASVAAAQALLQNLSYRNSLTDLRAQNTLALRVVDGAGGVSAVSQIIVNSQPMAAIFNESLVNSNTNGAHQTPAVARLTGGGYVVAWASQGQDGDGWGVYGQRYDGNGLAMGVEFQVNSVTSGNQASPQVVALANGGFVVAWNTTSATGSGQGVFAQRYAADGTAQGAQFQVNTTAVTPVSAPSLASYTNGFLAVWQGPSGFYGQRFDLRRQVVALANGGFVVAWNTTSATGGGQGVFAQRYAADGTAQGAQFQVNSTAVTPASAPSLASYTNGFLAVWQGPSGFYGQRFDLNGQQVGQEFLLNKLSGVSNLDPSWWFAFRPAIVAAADGSFVAVWQDQWPTYVHPYTVQAQRYNADDSLNGGLITVYNPGYSWNGNWSATPQVGLLSDGGFVAVWYDSSTNGLDGQRYDANGNAVNSVFQISSGTGDYQPSVTGLATGGFAVGYIGYNGNTGAINAFVNEYDAQGNLALSQQANSVTSGVQQVAVGDIGDGGFAAVWAGSQSGGAVQIKQQLFGSPLNLQQPSAQPVLSGVPGSVTYTLDGPAQLLAPAATLTDANAAVLNGGQVELSFTQGGGAAAQLGSITKEPAPGKSASPGPRSAMAAWRSAR